VWRERALKIVMALVGLLFTAGIYSVSMILLHRDQAGYTDAMMLSLYFVLVILLLMAVRNPAENRSLIAFAAWSSVAHAAVMAIMAVRDASQRGFLPGVYILVVIAIALIVLFPTKQSVARPLAAGGKD